MKLSEMIAVMQAAEDGAEIQLRLTDVQGDAWALAHVPVGWDWEAFDYRVKPRVPRECWINFVGGFPSSVSWATEAEAKESASSYNGAALTVYFREVIE